MDNDKTQKDNKQKNTQYYQSPGKFKSKLHEIPFYIY